MGKSKRQEKLITITYNLYCEMNNNNHFINMHIRNETNSSHCFGPNFDHLVSNQLNKYKKNIFHIVIRSTNMDVSVSCASLPMIN